MAVSLNRLNARQVQTIKAPGRPADGGGLYLVVDNSGARRWVFLFRWKATPTEPGTGKLREIGLGSAISVSLAAVREAAVRVREQIASGVDPIAASRNAKAGASVPTFGEVAEARIKAMEPAWRNTKHVAQWRSTLSLDRGQDGAFLDAGYCASIGNIPPVEAEERYYAMLDEQKRAA